MSVYKDPYFIRIFNKWRKRKSRGYDCNPLKEAKREHNQIKTITKLRPAVEIGERVSRGKEPIPEWMQEMLQMKQDELNRLQIRRQQTDKQDPTVNVLGQTMTLSKWERIKEAYRGVDKETAHGQCRNNMLAKEKALLLSEFQE